MWVSDINSNFATYLRTIIVVVALAALLWMTGEYESLSSISNKTALFLTFSGLATGVSWPCYFKALKMRNASQVAPVDKLSVVFVAVLGALFLGKKLSITGWSGVAIIAIGAVLVALP